MRIAKTYLIRYGDGKSAWLAEGISPEQFENVTEVKDILQVMADEGYVLFLDGEEVGSAVFIERPEDADKYEEKKIESDEEQI